MAHPPYTRDRLQEGLDLYYECEKNWAEMSRRWDRSRSACQHLVAKAKQAGLTPRELPKEDVGGLQSIIESLRSELDKTRVERDEAHASLRIASKPRFTVRADTAFKSEAVKVLVIGDAHDDPTIPDKRRFALAGRYCADKKHDVLLSIGDFINTNSLCFHVPDENYSGRAKPTFLNDMASAKLAFDALNSGLGNWKPEKHETFGNHENRVYRVEDTAPSAWGMYQSLLDEVMRNAGFSYSPYGAFHFYGGVAFTHVPKTIMGRPYGGKHPANQIGNDSVDDLVYGHTHVKANHVARKIGQKHVTIVNAACYLPAGHVEDYALHTPGGWHYGLTEVTIRRGRIAEANFISLETLEELYGSKV